MSRARREKKRLKKLREWLHSMAGAGNDAARAMDRLHEAMRAIGMRETILGDSVVYPPRTGKE